MPTAPPDCAESASIAVPLLIAPAALAEPTDATVDATRRVPRQWGRRRNPVQSAQPQALLTGATRRKPSELQTANHNLA